MAKSRFSRAQIVGILQQKDAGVPVQKLCCEHSVSHAAIYRSGKRRLQEQAPPVNPMTMKDSCSPPSADTSEAAATPSLSPTPTSNLLTGSKKAPIALAPAASP